jgi:hypothetical protein
MPIPLTVAVLKMNGRLIMMDAGSGVAQIIRITKGKRRFIVSIVSNANTGLKQMKLLPWTAEKYLKRKYIKLDYI